MRFDIGSSLTWLLAASTWTATTSASPLDILTKRSYSAIQGVSGDPCSRLEVRDLAKNNPDQWNLFLLSMQAFQNMDEHDKFSFYQLAAIHGQPFTPWNDFGRNGGGGMCPHVDSLFLPWHRPYLAAFEKALDDNMFKVIDKFPSSTRDRWARAHNCFRLPYWDSARRDSGGDTMPTTISDETVSVITPQGSQTIANPLSYYSFKSTAELGAGRWQTWQRSFRRPDTTSASAKANPNSVNTALNSAQTGLKDRVYDILTNQKLYRLASTEATGALPNNPESHDSIEAVHDAAHIIIGGTRGGHMYYLDYSAYDPVFWLHHCNMDRLGAIWQRINPNSYMNESVSNQNNAMRPAGTPTNADTGLAPWTKSTDGKLWTGNDVRYTETFGYFYPETGPGTSSGSAKSAVNKLYGKPAAQTTQKRPSWSGLFGRSLRPLRSRAMDNFQGFAPTVGQREYTVAFTYNKYAIDGSYAIYFFLGDPDSKSPQPSQITATLPSNQTVSHPAYDSNDADTFIYSPYFAGVHGVLSSEKKNGKSAGGSAAVHLTTTLQKHYDAGLLESLDDEDIIEKYLKDNLTWKVVTAGGNVLSASDVPDLEIGVVSKKVAVEATEHTFAEFYDVQTHTDVTAGKPAGYSKQEPIFYGAGGEPDKPSAGSCNAEKVIEYVYVNEQGGFLYSSN